MKMTQPKKFKNESQDARRRDQRNATHPEDVKDKPGHQAEKGTHSPDNRKNKW